MPGMMEEDVEMVPMLSLEEDDDSPNEEIKNPVPLLPLRNNVLFPGVVIPIAVGRDKSISAVKKAYKGNKFVGVIAQKDTQIEEPEPSDLYNIGTVARIVKMLKMPDGGTTLIIQGVRRFELLEIVSNEPHFEANIQLFDDTKPKFTQEVKAIMSNMKELAQRIIEHSPQIPNEARVIVMNIKNLHFLCHFIASNLNIETTHKQEILAIDSIIDRAQKVMTHMNQEFQLLELKNSIQNKVRTDIDKQQRDYFLHQQMKTIQEELGGDSFQQEILKMREKAQTKKWNKSVEETFNMEINKLQRINPAAAEYSIILNYLELLLELPWGEYTNDNFDLNRAISILDDDHYGLEKVKDRIVEYLAVLKLKGDLKSPILCFVGPPGVGKTSLGKSIAKALERKYIRMSLGGLHDESEIRGHRKTYIGAMPGRILANLKKAQSSNPVFILDEIDKVGKDHRGDPSSALLEVLDPEQNSTFYDNFLELDYDLSKVMFIATANDLRSIQPALRDRMEIIYISGYSIEEKVQIALKHLVKKQREAHGLKANQVKITAPVIQQLIQDYTRESGVRELDRVIAAVMRHVAKHVAMEQVYDSNIKIKDLFNILGKKKYSNDLYQNENPPGVSVGLAWTSVGGDILFIETSICEGKGNLTITGNLGNVFKESANTALSYLRSRAKDLNIPQDAFNNFNLHLHVPEGATPKDGPSAGIAIFTAFASQLTQKRVKPFLAMTGEITLRGKVLPVGGIKEKVLAAKRSGIKEIILCKENEKDILDINQDFLKGLHFHYVDHVDEVMALSLEKEKVKNVLNFVVKKEEKV
ncbi:MAG: endopeptidase La [Chitinophagales bacterium]|nr:endopeptidase La [Chitinophagales bacterium]